MPQGRKSWRSWRRDAIQAFINRHYDQTVPPRFKRDVGLGPIHPLHEGLTPEELRMIRRKLKIVDLLLFKPNEIWMVKAKMYPHVKDITMMEEYARLLPLTPDLDLDEHRHKPVKKFLIYEEEDPEVVQQARAEGVTVYLFQEGRFIEL